MASDARGADEGRDADVDETASRRTAAPRTGVARARTAADEAGDATARVVARDARTDIYGEGNKLGGGARLRAGLSG